jgi:hypothetical protein
MFNDGKLYSMHTRTRTRTHTHTHTNLHREGRMDGQT